MIKDTLKQLDYKILFILLSIIFALIALQSLKQRNANYSEKLWFHTDLKYKYKISRDFIAKNTLKGMKKTAIENMLGKPDTIKDHRYSYTLLADDIILWRKYLVIEFNPKSQRVVKAEIQHWNI